MQETTPLNRTRSKNLELIREDFLAASKRHPGLHSGLVFVTVPFPRDQAVNEILLRVLPFEGAYSKVIAEAAAGERVVLEVSERRESSIPKDVRLAPTCSVDLRPTMGFSDSVTRDFYFDDPPGDRSALRLYKELAASAARCCEEEGERLSNREALSAWHADLIVYSRCGADPILQARRLLIEVRKDLNRFRVGDAPAVKVPAGECIGPNGKCRPWADVLFDLSQCDCTILVLESGLFARGRTFSIG